eukprot:CAMPEP_0184324782 /NCGR_PEP_ID=MMETSP1049-20130417/136851_1 /TAXON_ID=77928 /ORGANISM="Proteomonas sulcata, Strain CCMP704" /LENGTH=49 /DNA_ID=CAMNT_0026646641 /DNA_START=48 /DNA_END=197 /DNA_ORIENTATION=+
MLPPGGPGPDAFPDCACKKPDFKDDHDGFKACMDGLDDDGLALCPPPPP